GPGNTSATAADMRRAASVAESLIEPAEAGDPMALDNTHAPLRGRSLSPLDAWAKTQCMGRSFPIPNILSHCLRPARRRGQPMSRVRIRQLLQLFPIRFVMKPCGSKGRAGDIPERPCCLWATSWVADRNHVGGGRS